MSLPIAAGQLQPFTLPLPSTISETAARAAICLIGAITGGGQGVAILLAAAILHHPFWKLIADRW